MNSNQNNNSQAESILGLLFILALIVYLFDPKRVNDLFGINGRKRPENDLDSLSADLKNLQIDSINARKRLMSEYES